MAQEHVEEELDALRSLSRELWINIQNSREKCVNDAADQLEEKTGRDLSAVRESEVTKARELDEAEKGRSGK